MDRQRLQLVAATSRLVLGVFALTLLPFLYPGLHAHRGILLGYLAIALVLQLLIWKQIGGVVRTVIGGIIDLVVLTFVIHRVGSVATMLVSIYFFGAVVNTLVSGRRVGVTLAVASATFYSAVVIAEAAGLIPYGPDAPRWARGAPGLGEGAIVCVLMSIMLVTSAWVIGVVVQRIRTREAELLDANARLAELSARDPLTHLFNRRHLMARLESELARVRRGHSLAVVMIDLDRFKRINDERGHEKGDEVLRKIAEALRGATREVDVPGRYGGDEFVVLLPDTRLAEAVVVGERLAAAVRDVGTEVDEAHPITASVGVAVAMPSDGARTLVRRADERAYRAKQLGGDRVYVEPHARDAVEESGTRRKIAPHREQGVGQ